MNRAAGFEAAKVRRAELAARYSTASADLAARDPADRFGPARRAVNRAAAELAAHDAEMARNYPAETRAERAARKPRPEPSPAASTADLTELQSAARRLLRHCLPAANYAGRASVTLTVSAADLRRVLGLIAGPD